MFNVAASCLKSPRGNGFSLDYSWPPDRVQESAASTPMTRRAGHASAIPKGQSVLRTRGGRQSPIDDTKPALRDAKPAFPVLRQRCIIELLSPEGRLVQAESANALGQATRRSPGLRGSARSCQIG